MGAPRILDFGPDQYKERKGVGRVFDEIQDAYKGHQERSAIDEILGEYKQNMGDAQAYEKMQMGLMQDNRIGPTKRLEMQSQLDQVQKTIIQKDKALNARYKQGIQSQKDREQAIQLQEDRGMPRYEAEAYVDGSKGVQSQIERAHQELVNRNLRQPRARQPDQNAQQSPNSMEQPIEQPMGEEGQQVIGSDEMNPAVQQEAAPTQSSPPIQKEKPLAPDEWPEMPAPKGMTNAERVKWENTNQKENNKELKETQTKKKGYQTNDMLIKSMKETSPYLPKGIEKMVIIDPATGDVRPSAQLAEQMNPETELYVKNLKQFLKGAKDFFGARVTNFDVNAFMAQLPTLMNSDAGRRVILNQMDLVNQFEATYNNTLNDGLKKFSRTANYADLLNATDKKVHGTQEELIGKINNVVKASKYMDQMAKNPEKFKDMTLMQDKDGTFKAIKNADVDRAIKDKWSKY